MYKQHEEKYKGVTIKVFTDDTTESPKEWGNDDVCFWDDRNLSVEHSKMNRDIFGAYIKTEGYEEYKEEAKEISKKYHIFGVDAYIHSGIALSLHGKGMNCRWDTASYIGCVLVEKKEARTVKKAEVIARGIVACWNDYLQGNVYGYMLEDTLMEGDFGGCWGFYGDYQSSGLIESAKDEIDIYLKNDRKDSIKLEVKHLREKADELEATLGKPKGYNADKDTLLCIKRGCGALQIEDGEFCKKHSK